MRTIELSRLCVISDLTLRFALIAALGCSEARTSGQGAEGTAGGAPTTSSNTGAGAPAAAPMDAVGRGQDGDGDASFVVDEEAAQVTVAADGESAGTAQPESAMEVAPQTDDASDVTTFPVVGEGAGVDVRSLGQAGDAGVSSGAAFLPPVATTAGDGPFATTQDLATGPLGNSGLFMPAEPGRDGIKHPVFIWGCGGMTNPAYYAELLSQVASHGIVVIAEVSTIGDDGAPLLAALEWLLERQADPESPLFQKLNVDHVAVGGHSIGSVNAFFVASDPRFSTSVHVAGGSLDDVNDPFAPTTGQGGRGLAHPVAYIASETDFFRNVEKLELDYANTQVPAFLTVMAGADHINAPNEGWPAVIAWLRWHIGGETERRSSFLDPDGEFQSGKYMSRTKNW